jgi:hypothetical protein
MGTLSVYCAAGEVALSGGYFSSTGSAFADRPAGATGWTVLIDNYDSPINGTGRGYVICAHA